MAGVVVVIVAYIANYPLAKYNVYVRWPHTQCNTD